MKPDLIAELMKKMTVYEVGVPQRVQHFLKVYGFCSMICRWESVPDEILELTEAAALVHDIGIGPALEKYGSDAGEYQQIEGPAPARQMLREVGFDEKAIQRICYLIAHHHTYHDIDGLDYQILVEADFLVNIFEGNQERAQIEQVREKIFRTQSGIFLLDQMFLQEKKSFFA